jgi:hypothetical protein
LEYRRAGGQTRSPAWNLEIKRRSSNTEKFSREAGSIENSNQPRDGAALDWVEAAIENANKELTNALKKQLNYLIHQKGYG